MIYLSPRAASQSISLNKIPSMVYQWPKEAKEGAIEQSIIRGSTTHLKSLEITVITLVSGESIETVTNEGSEKLIIVKSGQLEITFGDYNEAIGPGSIALILPEDTFTVSNLHDRSVQYYLFEYQSASPVDIGRGKSAGGSFLKDWNEVDYHEHSKGGRRDFFDRPTAMCQDFEMHVTNLNQKTSSHEPHTHVVEEIILMIQGKISMHIDGKEITAKAGDFAFIDSNVPHAPTNIGSGQAIYFAFQWK
jgi:(S)-ureidoglycine aminohydrolase